MFEVLEGGIQTTVQDFPGRVGYLDLGTYPAGPMDHFAFRVANLLVGNSQGAAALEVTVGGLKARFDDRRVLAVTGADMHARSEEHTSELQSLAYLVCRLLLEKKKINK